MLANQITPSSPATPHSTPMRDSGGLSNLSSISLSTSQVQEKQNSLGGSNGLSNEPNSLSASTQSGNNISPINSSNSSSNSSNIQSSSNKILPLYLMDARPKANAIANQAVGAGFEDTSRYKHTKLRFLQIANIHVMRESVRKLHELTLPNYNKNYDSTFLTNLDSTRWLEYICLIIQSSLRIAKLLHAGINVTIHCSDGWDRTSQLSSVSMLLLDPYYRTLEGFIVLIEKEWLAHGHKFKSRCGHIYSEGESETAPIFLQFIDCVWQLTQQFPAQFEFNSRLLILILDHANSGQFGTFLCNSDSKREDLKLKESTISLWTLVYSNKHEFTSPHYIGYGDDEYLSSISSKCCYAFLKPNTSMRSIVLWKEYYFRFDRTFNNFSLVGEQDSWGWWIHANHQNLLSSVKSQNEKLSSLSDQQNRNIEQLLALLKHSPASSSLSSPSSLPNELLSLLSTISSTQKQMDSSIRIDLDQH